MADTRELILARIEAVLKTVPGMAVENVFRNRGALPTDKRPAFVLLDGIERTVLGVEGRSRRGLASGPVIMALEPQIFLLQQAKAIDKSSEWGPEISAWRANLIRALTRDATLITLVGGNGDIAYLGCETDMQTGNTLEGTVQFNFAFRFVLDPTTL